MSEIATYLTKIQDLTQKNLDILTLLNDSLYSKKKYTSALIDDTTYTVPCFLYIENRLCDLENNWNRLVNAPKSGSAAFVFDESTRKINVEGFNNAPLPVDDGTISETTGSGETQKFLFHKENNDILKDLITPLVYLKSNLKDIPEHITQVSVRKIAFNDSTLYTKLNSSDKTWASANAILEGYTEDADYVMYDKIYSIPLRFSDYYGEYTIVDDPIKTESDTSINYTIVLDSNTYKYKDGTQSGVLKVNDYLITENDECILKISGISDLTLNVVVESGYKNLSKNDVLKYYKKNEFEESTSTKKDEKYIKIPLEEDKYVMIFIAAINKDLNLRSTWNTGQLFEVDNLVLDGSERTFREVYNSEIRNVGDILNDLTSFSTSTLSNIGGDTLVELTSYVPSFGDYSVELLNKHLLDSSSSETLVKLNKQKAELNSNITNIQNDIDSINTTLSTTDFSNVDPTVRKEYEQRLSALNVQKAQYTKELTSVINQISITGSSETLPISASKYVISGAIPYTSIESKFSGVKVIRFELLYRYKNINKDTSEATTLSDTVTVSNWNKYIVDYRQKYAYYDSESKSIKYKYEENSDGTTPRWSTFLVPISQGETVDMYYRIQYDLGYPYISLFSGWSEIVNVEFPEELETDTDVASIITTNNEDAENNRITSTLDSEGITAHVQDKLIDQDLTYFHHPESIASGFYTEDTRRIISLKEKLYELSNEIAELKSGAFGTTYKDIRVAVSYNNYDTVIPQDGTSTTILLPTYSKIESESTTSSTGTKTIYPTVSISNTNSTNPIKLYSMFPGSKTTIVPQTESGKFKFDPYYSASKIIKVKTQIGSENYTQQLYSQCLYFRIKDKWTDQTAYTYSDDPASTYLCAIPYVSSIESIQTTTANAGDSIVINPSETLTFTIEVNVKEGQDETKSCPLSFDIWSNPFADPISFDFKFVLPKISSSVNETTSAASNREYTSTISSAIDTELSGSSSSINASQRV